MKKPVLVIGGGIAGIQASLDLADRGLKVHLVEKSPSIGGVMAQLDKTFPTMDCSMCILAPKMIECFNHPNIKLYTLSEIIKVTGSVGDFNVKIVKHPKYVDATKCTGCGVCSEKCPVTVLSEFQMHLGNVKAISVPFPQAIPLMALINTDQCLYFKKGVCKICEKFCPFGAIDYEQKPKNIDLNIAAIIIASGFEQYAPNDMGEYGYGKYPNVITSLEFERLICASGPTGGQIKKPSDGELAHRIAFVQCVGSRSHKKGYPFCSSVCCMYATKEAILIKEHDPESEVSIFYIDLKVFGQGFQDFVDRARKQWGVEYIRGRPGEIRKNPMTNGLIIWYEDTETGEVDDKEVDLVVLCTTMIARPENQELSKILGVPLDDYGFFKPKDPLVDPLSTDVPGIFIAGCCHGPKDIPESVTEASGSAGKAAEIAIEPLAIGEGG